MSVKKQACRGVLMTRSIHQNDFSAKLLVCKLSTLRGTTVLVRARTYIYERIFTHILHILHLYFYSS